MVRVTNYSIQLVSRLFVLLVTRQAMFPTKHLDTNHPDGCLKKNLNASRPSEHPPVRGKNVKIFRWDYRLQRQNIFMAFNRVPQR